MVDRRRKEPAQAIGQANERSTTENNPPQAAALQRSQRGGPLGSGEADFPELALASILLPSVDLYVVWYYNTYNMEYQRDEHRVHLIVYHLIWCPKRRKRVLVGHIAAELQRLVQEKCDQRGWNILQLAIQPDHVHLFVRVFPSNSASDVVKEIKGFTSHELREMFPQLKTMPSMWTRSFFASTAGNISEATIRAYIEAQKGI
jgi:putative transposase